MQGLLKAGCESVEPRISLYLSIIALMAWSEIRYIFESLPEPININTQTLYRGTNSFPTA